MTDKTRFWNKIADNYAAKPVANEAVYEKKLALSQARMRSDMDLLEIGCGTGTTALRHASFVNKVFAVDFSSRMIEIAKEKAAKQNIENVEFICADISSDNKKHEIQAKEFDMVMAHSLLHLVPDRQAVLRQLYQQLKPGGIFISSTVCLSGAWSLLKPIWPICSALGIFPDVKFFKAARLVQDIQQAGFEIDYQWQNGPSLFVIALKAPQPQTK
ncbi:class I SAM-dependent methyltransferase [Agaribacterium haliotis]|uniref:class I SAM-dependent methyltransferase n=1 Tax=Agaribacterium haliotis TaxID=2013869 RepID=UPI000BB541C7|nr:class I SAM-dependent methyltransferase [Agaribacterium haliotis]